MNNSGLQIKSRITTINFFPTAHHALSKSVAVASTANTHATLLPHTCFALRLKDLIKTMTKINTKSIDRKDSRQEHIHLSKLEITLLTGICQGLSSKKLTKFIHKSPRSIDDYRTKLYKKFNVQNKEQLIVRAVALKLIQFSEPD